MYRQLCNRKGLAIDAKREDLEQQLLHVKRTIVELGKIVKATRRRAAREAKLAAAAIERKIAEQNQAAEELKKQETKGSFRSSVDTIATIRSVWRN